MKSARFTPRRYQLKKEGTQVVLTGHPWIFRTHVSTAAAIFKSGQWLQLVDHTNAVLGYGIFEPEGLIGIRVLKAGKTPPSKAWFEKQLDKAFAKRELVKGYTNSYRILHGENDGFPGVVIDVYGESAVLQTYSPSVDRLGRYLALLVRHRLGLKNVIWKLPVKRKTASDQAPSRVLYGNIPGLVRIREGKLQLAVEIGAGQKSGTFLDLRGLRKWVAVQKLEGLRVLNLFAYTGTLAMAAERAGAKEVVSVDISQGALDFGKKQHSVKKEIHTWIAADIFKWLPELGPKEKFDLIIVDPPAMASQTTQVPNALRAYKHLYRSLLPHLNKRGTIVACCCTSRIARKRFRLEMDKNLGRDLTYKSTIEPEDDHPVGFPEGDYLKLLVYKR